MDEESASETLTAIYDETPAASRLHQRRSTSINSDIYTHYEGYNGRRSSIIQNDLGSLFSKKQSETRRASVMKQANNRFNNRRLSKSLQTKGLNEAHILVLRKKLIRAIKLTVFSIHWCKWAYKYNTEMKDKYLSFSQLYDFDVGTDSNNNNNNNDKLNDGNPDIVSFNKDYFKAKKSVLMNINSDIKNILAKIDVYRTKTEIETLRTFFKNMRSISTLPNEMQTKIFKKCWLEVYEPKRVIIRQNHRPEYFYFILSGSLVVTNRPENSNISYTVCFLDAGTSFGELALLSKSLRTSTVISRTRVELLILAKEDFYHIFGGEKSNDDDSISINENKTINNESRLEKNQESHLSHIEFLKNLRFLNGWSFDSLIKNPQSIVFCYFPRGQVLVRNGNFSKYIYIVKKGSISVWIKIRRRKDKFENEKVVKKYLSRRKSNDSDLDDYEQYQHNNNKDDDIAINSKLGSKNSYIESDSYLKEQHNEAIGSHFRVDHHKKPPPKSESPKEQQKSRLNYLMEYLNMTKNSNKMAIEVKTSKGSKILPGIVDKRDRLKILETSSEKEPSYYNDPFLADIEEVKSARSRISQEIVEIEDRHTFTKGLLHLPKIRVEKVNKKAEIRKSFDSRRSSTYVVKLPSIDNRIQERKNIFEIPKKQFKTTIELIESADANSRRESLANFENFSKKHKHLAMSTAMFKSSTPNKNQLLPSFDKDLLKDEKDEDYITEYIEVQVLENGSHFGLAEILFESQPNVSLISNGCDCILLPKDLFIQNATTQYIRELRRDEIPFPTMNEITRSYNEYSSWKKYTSQLVNHTTVNTKRHKRTKENKIEKSRLKLNKSTNQVLKSSIY